jgi:cyclohexa-1,5-dienecarbonyl-CoA hydratase
MSEAKTIQYEVVDAVARVTLDRPKHNVFNISMMQQLNAVLDDIAANPELKCMVMLAKGASWCAGVDVGDHKPELVDAMIGTFNGIFQRMHALEIPTIAAVQGACLGGGMEVAIGCDIILASKKAVFGQPEVRLGFFPPYAAIRLPELVGVSKAIEICTSGKSYTADEALSMGFVSRVVEADVFEGSVEKLLADFRASSPLILKLNKLAVKQHLGVAFPAAVSGVSHLFLNQLMKTQDTLEGIASFYEKRKPAWKNA